MSELKTTIIEKFKKKGVISSSDIDELDKNFVSGGLIDSVEIVEIVSSVEEDFGFAFNEDDFASTDFETVAGFIRLAENRKQYG